MRAAPVIGRWFAAVLGCLAWLAAAASTAPPSYHAIEPAASGRTVVLTGVDLSIEQLLLVARHGALVELSGAAAELEADNFGLLMEAGAEGVPVYNLNRGGGLRREVVTLSGDPSSPANQAALEKRELEAFEQGADYGDGPEVDAEEIVRAAMLIRANQMVHEAPSPQLSRRLLDLLNRRITPVMQSHGTVGESDWNLLPNIAAAMVGKGDVYLRGRRMTAAQALRQVGLAPLRPAGCDSSTFANSNGYTTALAAFLVETARQALAWSDLAHAMDLNAMNSSITPLTAPVQRVRPQKWLNWDAARVLDMIKGSYLLNSDPQRILTDPDSLRASAIRQGAAWQAWSRLRDSVVLQMNSSDHNPSVLVGLSPDDSWELSTPQMLQYYVKGGPHSRGKHGYIVASANWDPFPLVGDVEAFTNALANVAVVVSQRIYRFANPFFTGVDPAEVLATVPAARLAPEANPMVVAERMQELQLLAVAVPAAGIATDPAGNGDIQAQGALKVSRGLEATDLFMHLLGQDLLTSTHWLELRKLQDHTRSFGPVVDAAMGAFRARVPADGSSARPVATLAYEFVRDTPTSLAIEDVPR